MKTILIWFLTIISFYDKFDERDYIRQLFYYSVESEDSLKKFEKKLKSIESITDKSFYNLYKGAYLTLIAKHSFNPYTKYYKLKEGLEYIEKAIKENQTNIEFRFVRLSILNYVPSFLGYDNIFYDDYKVLVSQIEKMKFEDVDKKTQIGIIEFLLRSSKVPKSEKQNLDKLIKELQK